MRHDKSQLARGSTRFSIDNAKNEKLPKAGRYRLAETGASISAPVKQGYKFIGWSLTEGGEIAFGPTDAISLKEGFTVYMTANGLDFKVTYQVFEQEKIADFGAAVKTDGGFNAIVGCDANIDTIEGVVVIEKTTVTTGYLAQSRYVARLTDNGLAVHLYTYLTTAKA